MALLQQEAAKVQREVDELMAAPEPQEQAAGAADIGGGNGSTAEAKPGPSANGASCSGGRAAAGAARDEEEKDDSDEENPWKDLSSAPAAARPSPPPRRRRNVNVSPIRHYVLDAPTAIPEIIDCVQKKLDLLESMAADGRLQERTRDSCWKKAEDLRYHLETLRANPKPVDVSYARSTLQQPLPRDNTYATARSPAAAASGTARSGTAVAKSSTAAAKSSTAAASGTTRSGTDRTPPVPPPGPVQCYREAGSVPTPVPAMMQSFAPPAQAQTKEYLKQCIDAARHVLEVEARATSSSATAASSSAERDTGTQKPQQGAEPVRSVNLDDSSDDEGMGNGASGSGDGASGSVGGGSRAPQVKRMLFDGAAAAAREVTRPQWRCADCEFCTSKVSEVAYLTNRDNTFVKYVDKNLDDAMKEAHGGAAAAWKNKYEDFTSTRLVCFSCCEKLHKKSYRQPDGHEKAGKLTPEWDRLRKQSFQMNVNKTKTGFILKQTDKIAQDRGQVREVSAAELYDKLVKHDGLKRSRDWVTDMGPLAVLLYGCPCGCYPMKNGCWYKCVKWGTTMEEGMTNNGEGTGAYWVCAVCGLRWFWKYGHLRLFVVGTRESIMEGRYWFRHVGHNVDTNAEAKILYIKGIRMLQELDGRRVTTNNILDCIESLNAKVDEKLCAGVREVAIVRSKDVSDQYQVYCDTSTLSMPGPGKYFKAIDLRDEEPTEAFSAEQLHQFLDTLCGCLNVSDVPTEPAMKAVRSSILQSPHFQDARARLQAIVSHVVPGGER